MLSKIVTHSRATCLALLSSLLLSGCSVVQTPDYSTQAQAILQSQDSWDQATPVNPPSADLLSLIDVPALNALVDQGLKANPGLLQTATALKISSARLRNERGNQLPSADLNINRNAQKDTASAYTANLDISWTLDIWGSIRDGVSASKAQLEAARASLKDAQNLLAAQIIDTHLQLIQQRHLITIRGTQLSVLESNEAAIVGRYKKGLSDLTDLDNARSATEQARATLIDTQEQEQLLQRAMVVLLGGQQHSLPPAGDFPEVLTPVAGLPPQDLARRPDLKKAYANIVAAEATSRAAYKALLPNISLKGSLTDSAGNLSDALFKSSSWSLLSQLTAPLFHGGQLRTQAEISRLQAEQQYLAYQEALLNAVNEIENALGKDRALGQQQHHISNALANAERSFVLYRSKYRQGLATYLELTQVQTQTFDLQVQLTQVVYQRLSNRITLGLALGLGASA